MLLNCHLLPLEKAFLDYRFVFGVAFLIVGATFGRPRTVNLRSKYGRTVPTELGEILLF